MKRTIWEEIAIPGYNARNMREALEDGAVCALLEEKGVTQEAIEEVHELLKTAPETAPVCWCISEAGREYIIDWLLERVKSHSKAGCIMDSQIDAYETAIIDSFMDGNGAYFEERSSSTVSGHTECCYLEPEMLEVAKINPHCLEDLEEDE